MTSANIFGVAVALPAGWEEETVYLFAGPAATGAKDKERARPTITAARLRAASLDDAIVTLGSGGVKQDVLFDELREDDGRRYYERVGRFSDPATGAAVQQGTRVYFANGVAWVVALTTAAIEFKDAYGGFAKLADQIARSLTGKAA